LSVIRKSRTSVIDKEKTVDMSHCWDIREYAVELVRSNYADFGPSLAAEMLLTKHDLKVSRETLRKWMMGDGFPADSAATSMPSPGGPRNAVNIAITCRGLPLEVDSDILIAGGSKMILVVGGTGTLGGEICQRLRARGLTVRALVRRTANSARLKPLRDAGVNLCWGDLKDVDSLRNACHGVNVVISTASSTLSRQDGDSIESVDHQGQLYLIAAARAAGVEHFTFVTIPRKRVRESPLTRAKAEAERALADSGMGYTILAANYFMEIWLSPALGFDYPRRKVALFGDGRALITWVSYRDVAEFAVCSHLTPGAHNRILDVGGPKDLSPLEVVGIFEEVSGAPFERQFVPEEALLAQLDSATDPLAETFAKLQLEYVHGCPMNTSETLGLIPIDLTSVAQYAAAVCGQSVTSA
jgi:uncharacterized protein YbjT (DUF2867 family)